MVEIEKEIFRDMWRFLKEHCDPPAIGADECIRFWEKAAWDICFIVTTKWKNHPLALNIGVAIYGYLESKCKAKDGDVP